jgi:hypothetical protein
MPRIIHEHSECEYAIEIMQIMIATEIAGWTTSQRLNGEQDDYLAIIGMLVDDYTISMPFEVRASLLESNPYQSK